MSQTGLSPSNNTIPLAAENYQLKWNSHVTNLNSSISNLFKNDKYADVMLFTCNADEG
jgi:GDNF-inducible zinc finger protein 1